MKASKLLNIVVFVALTVAVLLGTVGLSRWIHRERVLREIIERLGSETRLADVLVTKSEYDEVSRRVKTTIKFLEYDTLGKPLEPKYFTFRGNIIQFQSLVVRFQDKFVEAGDRLRGKSIALFMKAFVLDGPDTQEFEITSASQVPDGYRIEKSVDPYEKTFWEAFWRYALDPAEREAAGVKNAQIEAPGSLFLPGTIYSLVIEHDGGIRIDAKPVPEIMKGEQIDRAAR
ncbi:MAG: hypothetical protein KTQ49_08265 [Candidatus Omnitrophica bacterium]|nr:hypothetical protein [Candidatus Omnitrophota bacterium]